MSIRSEPHVEVSSIDLANWIQAQGESNWWSVDGDPLLTDKMSFPCPGDELAETLRQFNRSVLIQDPQKRESSNGRVIDTSELGEFTDLLGNNVKVKGKKPAWAEDRFFYCCWKDSKIEWMLTEDKETSESSQRDEKTFGANR